MIYRVGLVFVAIVLFASSLSLAQESESSEKRIWVPIPSTQIENGGFTIRTPGEMPITVRPDWSGGYRIEQVGEMPVSVKPTWGGGYKVQTDR